MNNSNPRPDLSAARELILMGTACSLLGALVAVVGTAAIHLERYPELADLWGPLPSGVAIGGFFGAIVGGGVGAYFRAWQLEDRSQRHQSPQD